MSAGAIEGIMTTLRGYNDLPVDSRARMVDPIISFITENLEKHQDINLLSTNKNGVAIIDVIARQSAEDSLLKPLLKEFKKEGKLDNLLVKRISELASNPNKKTRKALLDIYRSPLFTNSTLGTMAFDRSIDHKKIHTLVLKQMFLENAPKAEIKKIIEDVDFDFRSKDSGSLIMYALEAKPPRYDNAKDFIERGANTRVISDGKGVLAEIARNMASRPSDYTAEKGQIFYGRHNISKLIDKAIEAGVTTGKEDPTLPFLLQAHKNAKDTPLQGAIEGLVDKLVKGGMDVKNNVYLKDSETKKRVDKDYLKRLKEGSLKKKKEPPFKERDIRKLMRNSLDRKGYFENLVKNKIKFKSIKSEGQKGIIDEKIQVLSTVIIQLEREGIVPKDIPNHKNIQGAIKDLASVVSADFIAPQRKPTSPQAALTRGRRAAPPLLGGGAQGVRSL